MADAEIIDLSRARRVRAELQAMNADNPHSIGVRPLTGNGQMSFDQLDATGVNDGGIVIEGIHFNCTVWSGGRTV